MSTRREIVIDSFGGKNDKLPAYKITKGRVPKAQTAENCVLDSDGGIVTKMGGRSQKVTLDNSTWVDQYEGDVLPPADTPAWTRSTEPFPGGTHEEIHAGPPNVLHLTSPTGTNTITYSRTPASISNDDGSTLTVRLKVIDHNDAFLRIIIQDGKRSAEVEFYNDFVILNGGIDAIGDRREVYVMDTTDDFHIYSLSSIGNHLWLSIDGVVRLVNINRVENTATSLIFGNRLGSDVDGEWDYVYFMNSTRIEADRILSLHNFESREGASSLIAGTGDGLVEIPDIEESTVLKKVIATGLNPNYRPAMVNHFGKSYIFNGFNVPMVYDLEITNIMNEDTTGYQAPIGRYPVIYQDLIFVFNLQDLPNGYGFTDLINTGSTDESQNGVVIEPDHLSTTDDPPAGERRAWPKERRFELKKGRSITGAIQWPESQAILIGQEDSLWIHEGGDPIEFQATLEEQKEQIGLLSHESLRIYQGMALFIGIAYGKQKGVFSITQDGNVERISIDLDTTFESIHTPVLRHNLANYERDFALGTLSDSAKITINGDQVELTGTGTSETWTSPVYYAEDLNETTIPGEWGTFESTVSLDTTNAKNNITFEFRAATTRVGVTGSYYNIVDGQRIGEIDSSIDKTKIYYQIKATLTRVADTDPAPALLMAKSSWIVGGEWQETPLAIVHDNRYYLFCSDGDTALASGDFDPGYGTKYINRCFVFQRVLREGGFTWDWTELSEDRWNISCVAHLRDKLYGGSAKDDKIFQLDTTQADDGADITFKYKTGIYRAENPAVVNRIDRRVYVETEGADSFDFIIYRDGGTAQTFSQVGRGTSRIVTEIAMPEGQNFRELEFEINETVDGDFKWHGARIKYREFPGRRLL